MLGVAILAQAILAQAILAQAGWLESLSLGAGAEVNDEDRDAAIAARSVTAELYHSVEVGVEVHEVALASLRCPPCVVAPELS